jgi:hypothetical protein
MYRKTVESKFETEYKTQIDERRAILKPYHDYLILEREQIKVRA